uniref:Ferredoxin-dependent glutamate synthase n=1 Tax=Helminthora furcellata TaxID=1884666 RepID=A0A1G4NR54_9FLOR|nr:Glutamate synthase [Helminthora furcellata]SCW21095.1 Glutamate synthase [Helminthora furcellata]SCW23955.1 Glutamate synthase [Helminthora furcellata]
MQALKYNTSLLLNYSGQPSVLQERDACGVGFLARPSQDPTHQLVIHALTCLTCMEHRGACSADRDTGDGAGIMTQIPWELLENFVDKASRNIGVAMIFLPSNGTDSIEKLFEWVVRDEKLEVLGWRNVPIIPEVLGKQARTTQPVVKQFFVKSNVLEGDLLEATLYAVRKRIEKLVAQQYSISSNQFYICSFSSRTIVYKGMLRSAVLGQFYQDLYNPKYKSTFAIYHRRFSTNTMPKWPLAQPMRFIAHNGEINTLLGNLNWMKSKESLFNHNFLKDRLADIKPVVNYENSDSANLDAATEILVSSGRSPEEALMILIPEAYKNQPALDAFPDIVDFYDYYSHLQEPWDGPALVVFSDGKSVGATLDRNGLRPARYCVTDDGLIIVSSESGVLELEAQSIIKKGRLGPGQMLSVNMQTGILSDNWSIKNQVAKKLPYGSWLRAKKQLLLKQPYLTKSIKPDVDLMKFHTAFGYSNEDVELVIEHMASSAKEPTFCMGDDIPLAILSSKPHLLYDYFKQKFAQVTNPAIDPLRESLVMSLNISLGPKGDLLSPDNLMAKRIQLDSPVINENELEQILQSDFNCEKICTFYSKSLHGSDLREPIRQICDQALSFAKNKIDILILTDFTDVLLDDEIFIPPLLIVGAVHHHLIEHNLRQQVSIVVETAQCWNTHHFACLIGYGASAVCPYLAFQTARNWCYHPRTQKLMNNGKIDKVTVEVAQNNYRVAIEAGLLKILSKMGISLLSSYHGAQIFEILGLGQDIVNLAFKGTVSRVNGMNLGELSFQVAENYTNAFNSVLPKRLTNLGYVQYRPGAEYHVNNPEMSKTLHKAVRSKDIDLYTKYKELLQNRPPTNLRDLLTIKNEKSPISIEQVESVDSILSRFCTGGMSLGALSRETHETLAIAMNRIGGKSNSGEGGEDPIRYTTINDVNESGIADQFAHLKGLQKNDLANSAIKQIASGRFGVTPEYLMSGLQLEIKIAQGAKPGEGGQLPGKKVSPYIAGLRNCKPGVTLISPPPHHDIYSIEDLSQLIFDLHQINPSAKVSVKLVAQSGIGTVAAGVAKGNADIIQISGHDGGTGASPLSSIKHAGGPWELGITEVHQLLLENNLRDRVVLRVDGGLRTGLDIVLAAIMGAQEFGFGTVAMIATGCVMARICHTNNCPVGVATQRQDLRNRYPGIPSDLVNFFIFVAEEVRAILASLGCRNLQEITGQVNLLKQNEAISLNKTSNLQLDSLLVQLSDQLNMTQYFQNKQPNSNGPVLDDELLSDPNILHAISNNLTISKKVKIVNTNRSVGARISGKIVNLYGNYGFNGGLNLSFYGSAGQSFGAFICRGISFSLYGEANDYVGKGMNGGEIIIVPPVGSIYDPAEHVILGNTCLYGATGGYLFANGQAGERFAVRNSVAQAVVEGVGDHACEYMTGGTVVVIGPAGRNIAAGMTGGIAYLLDEEDNVSNKINQEIVKVQRIQTNEGAEHLKGLLSMHLLRTKSAKSKLILDNWSKFLPLFVQLVPPSEVDSPITNISISQYKFVI